MLWVFAMGLLMFWVLAQVKRAHPKIHQFGVKKIVFFKEIDIFQ